MAGRCRHVRRRRGRGRGRRADGGRRTGPHPGCRPAARVCRPARRARVVRPPHHGRGRKAHPRRPYRGGPRRHDLSGGRRGGAPARRRGRGAAHGPGRPWRGPVRADAASADRPHRCHLAVQLPAQPRRAQAGAGLRRRQPGGPQARVADAVVGPRAGRTDATVRRARWRPVRAAHGPHARRPARGGRPLQGAHLHRVARRRLGHEGQGRPEEGHPRTGRQCRRHRGSQRRRRRGRAAHRHGRVRLRRPELHRRPACVRARRQVGRLPRRPHSRGLRTQDG